MNHRADSLKKNLPSIVPKLRIVRRGWLLSHTMRRSRGKNRENGIEMTFEGSQRANFLPLTSNPFALNLPEHQWQPAFSRKRRGLPNKARLAGRSLPSNQADGGSAMEARAAVRSRRLFRLFGFARLDAGRFSRKCGLDAERHPRPDRRDRGLGVPEENPAARRELLLFPYHAGRDTVDVGNVGAA